MQKFIVSVQDKEGIVHNIICDDKTILSNLLLHLDDGEYQLGIVHVLDNVITEIKDVCVKNNLEHGGSQ